MADFWLSNKQALEIPLIGRQAFKVFFCFAFAYFISYSFRSVNAVLSPELINDLEISSGELGLLSSSYLIGFGLAQIPVGILLDKYGPRITEISLMIFAVVGALLFYSADNFALLFAGRMLIGVGVSSCLMSALSGFRSWYPIDKQPQLTSAMLIFGTSGALFASAPVRILLPYIGWRGVFLSLAMICAVSVVILYFFLPVKTPKEKPTIWISNSNKVKLLSWESYRPILTNPNYLRLLPVGAISLGGFIALQTLWLGPWLINVMHYTSEKSSQLIFWFNAVLLITYLINTFFLPKLQLIGVSTFSFLSWMTGISLVAQGAAFFLHGPLNIFWWGLYAITSASFVLAQSLVITSFPISHSGRVSTTYNVSIFIGASLMQWGIGYFIDKGIGWGLAVPEAFTLSMGLYLIIQTLGFTWLILAPKFLPQFYDSDNVKSKL